ncbi:MAG: hypothetical protein QOI66_2566 [Myxococcales bacterium]|jgi:iron-sulfur cluster repair protein YtfE (RIC family)|nr:hypothetical protein [Myxococcales bacterium]
MRKNLAPKKADSVLVIGWVAPQRRLDAGTALRAILSQHEKIRLLLTRARSVADAALDQLPVAPDAVASVIGDLRSTMEIHLTFEERTLLPLLEADPPLGPERAQRLREEHRQQRHMLATIHGEASAHPTLPTLAAKLVFLAAWLIADMNEEERCLLVSDVVRDDSVAVDQNTG